MPNSLETALVRQLKQGLLRLFRQYTTNRLTEQTTNALYRYIAQSRRVPLEATQRISSELQVVAESVVSDLQLAKAELADDPDLLYRHARRFASVCESKARLRLSSEAREMLNNVLRDGVRRLQESGDYKSPVRVTSAQLSLISLFSILAQAKRERAELVLLVSAADLVVAKKKLCPVYPF